MERLIGFDPQLLFDSAITAVNVFILFFVLSYFLFNPVKDFLNKRKNAIAADLENAAGVKKTALSLKDDYEARLKKINMEAEEILREADKKAKIKKAQMIEEAKEEAARIMDRTQRELNQRRIQAEDAMKQEMVQLAALMTAKAVSGLMDARAQEAMIEKTLKEIGEVTWQA